jgi:predicted MarR family transcription regulator
MAVFAALVGFCNVVVGFRNADMVERVGALLDEIPYSCRQATYDLRRLKRKGLILKIPRSHRYQLTALGRRVAVLFTKTYGRVLAPGLTALDPHLPDDLAAVSPVAVAWRRLDRTLDQFTQSRFVAA